MGRMIRARPLPGAIGLTARMPPVVLTASVAFMAPDVLRPPVVLRAPVVRGAPWLGAPWLGALPNRLASAVRWAPVARIDPVVLLSAPVVLAGSSFLMAPVDDGPAAAQGGDCSAGCGSVGCGPVSIAGQAPVSRRGIAPVSRRAGGGACRPGAGGRSDGCAPVWRAFQEVVHRRPISGSAHSGGGNCCAWGSRPGIRPGGACDGPN